MSGGWWWPLCLITFIYLFNFRPVLPLDICVAPRPAFMKEQASDQYHPVPLNQMLSYFSSCSESDPKTGSGSTGCGPNVVHVKHKLRILFLDALHIKMC